MVAMVFSSDENIWYLLTLARLAISCQMVDLESCCITESKSFTNARASPMQELL